MDRVEERSLNPGKEMRESELLFQVILTQVACTKDSRGEAGGRAGSEGVKVHRHRLLRWATYGGGRGGRHGSVCACAWGARKRGESPHLPGRKSGAPLREQPKQALVGASRPAECGPPSKQAAGRRVKMYVREALHIFSLVRGPTVSHSILLDAPCLQFWPSLNHVT